MINKSKIWSRIPVVISALIMLQTLYFKFSAAPESVYIFTTLGLEPIGRIGIGIAELLASIGLIFSVTRFYAAIMGSGIMLGAIFSHLTTLGIEVQNDGCYLFVLCLIVFISCLSILYFERQKFSVLRKLFIK